jgi:SAM-dependent methyltransferase
MEDVDYNGKSFNYLRCKNCALIQIHPLPNSDDLTTMYPVDYQIKTLSETDKNWQEIKHYFPNSFKSILEFGCGNASFLSSIKTQQPMIEVTGVEYNVKMVELLQKNNPDIHFISTSTCLNSEKCFDVIYLDNVIEHLTNPSEILNILVKKLNPDGLLIARGPLEDNFNIAQYFRKIVFGLRKLLMKNKVKHVPWHVSFWNYNNQLSFFERVGLSTKHYEISETSWPFPSLTSAKGLKQIFLAIIGKCSIRTSSLFNKMGNTFLYVGSFKKTNK